MSEKQMEQEAPPVEGQDQQEPENHQPGNGWGDIAEEFGLNFEEVEGVEVERPETPGTGMQQGHDPATDAEKLFAAEVAIRAALKFVVASLFDLEVPDKRYDELATSTAAVIVKWYKGGIFEFMAKWREELAFGMAMLAFVGAVREASKVKNAKEVTPEKEEGAEKDAE
ncbi:MAG: hypothetical protein ABNH42_19735 [Marinobacter sp.]|jgi:hypothetical protein